MEAKITAIQISNSLPLSQRELETSPKLDAILPIFMIFGICAAIAISTTAYIFRGWQQEQIIKSKNSIICDGCKYYNNNHYLQCALRPTTVMTEQSINCEDYSPIHQVKQIEKVSKVLVVIRKVFNK